LDSPNFLDGYIPDDEFAAQANVCTRTVDRYRNQPDGLPFVKFANRIYIPLLEAREWLKGRVKRPNPRRKAA
jgi:hypothetical protein